MTDSQRSSIPLLWLWKFITILLTFFGMHYLVNMSHGDAGICVLILFFISWSWFWFTKAEYINRKVKSIGGRVIPTLFLLLIPIVLFASRGTSGLIVAISMSIMTALIFLVKDDTREAPWGHHLVSTIFQFILTWLILIDPFF